MIAAGGPTAVTEALCPAKLVARFGIIWVVRVLPLRMILIAVAPSVGSEGNVIESKLA